LKQLDNLEVMKMEPLPENPKQQQDGSDADPKYAGQADAGDTSFVDDDKHSARQPSSTAGAAGASGGSSPAPVKPVPGTGLDSGSDDEKYAGQSDAGDTSFAPDENTSDKAGGAKPGSSGKP
jgi:hypothetical protein